MGIDLTKKGKMEFKEIFNVIPGLLDLIENEEYKKLYNDWSLPYNKNGLTFDRFKGLLTVLLIHIGINPLEYFDYAPAPYIDSGTPFKVSEDFSLAIPGNIKVIPVRFISDNKIKKFIIEEGVETINQYSFDMTAPVEVEIPESIQHIDQNSFPRGSTLIFSDYDLNKRLPNSRANPGVWFRGHIGTIILPNGEKVVFGG